MHPWMKFYPSDWRADPALRCCSMAARGLWVELLCIMHEAEPRGHLLVGKSAPTLRQLAAISGCSLKSLNVLLEELLEAGVYSVKDGIIFSRRMVRDEERATRDRENGKLGGNPKVKGGVNPQVKAQIPEARSQIPDSKKEAREVALLFDVFWQEWPNKVGKPAALKAFNAAIARGASPAEIQLGVGNYIRDKPPDRSWLNPATFLNQNRWEDQPAKVENGKDGSISSACDNLVRLVSAGFGGPASEERFSGPEDENPPRLLAYGGG